MPKDRPFQLSLRALILLTLVAGVLLAGGVKYWEYAQRRIHFRKKYTATLARIKSIEVACAAYEFDWGEYPPDVGQSGEKSSSAIIYYLSNRFRKTPAKGEIWSTQDCGPYFDLPPQMLKTTSTGRVQIVDAWGNPIQYDNIRDDKSTPNGFTSYGADDIRTDGKPRNPKGYDLFSRGDPAKNAPVANFEETK